MVISSPSVNKHDRRRQFLFRVISKKSSPLKPSSQMNRNLVGNTYGRFCIKFPQNRIKGEWHRLSTLSLQYCLAHCWLNIFISIFWKRYNILNQSLLDQRYWWTRQIIHKNIFKKYPNCVLPWISDSCPYS